MSVLCKVHPYLYGSVKFFWISELIVTEQDAYRRWQPYSSGTNFDDKYCILCIVQDRPMKVQKCVARSHREEHAEVPKLDTLQAEDNRLQSASWKQKFNSPSEIWRVPPTPGSWPHICLETIKIISSLCVGKVNEKQNKIQWKPPPNLGKSLESLFCCSHVDV
jgi:hypothetical protein